MKKSADGNSINRSADAGARSDTGTDTGKLASEIKEAFGTYGFPEGFTGSFDQLECLSHHQGRETFLVQRKEDGMLCVAKCYPKDAYDPAGSHDILAGLDHPGLPEPVGVYSNDSMTCVAREYIEGTPLDEYVDENELTREEITDICVRLADILSYLHGQTPPVIHRDLKPENIIVRGDGSLCLIDFDIARTFKESEESDTVFFGTKGYAPPEQYGFAQTDARADIYSFGVLLRFLLTGSTRRNKNVKVYGPLAKIIDKCTAFSPEDRYRDIDQVKKALKQADPRSQMMRFVRIAACILLAAALLGFAGYRIYEKLTYSPYTDGRVVASVMPDEERQAEAVKYMQDKFGTHIFDDTDEYMTIGMIRELLVEAYGLDEDYVYASDTEEPPDEDGDWFMPWPIDDDQYVNRIYLLYFVTKLYWPDVVADWSSIKDDNGYYPGCRVAENWCEKYDISIGVNRPMDNSRGEAAIAFANADRIYEAMKADKQ